MKTVIVLTAAMVAVAAAGAAMAGDARAPVGMVSLAEGKAEVVTGGAAGDALPGMELYEGDAVVTGQGGKVKILFRDDSLVTVGADARLEISAYAVEPSKKLRKSVLTLVKGKVLNLVSRVFSNPDSKFEVKTHTAVAGVRGTRFVVETGTKDRIATLEGSVAVRKADGKEEVLVAAGNYTEVGDGVGAALAMSDDLKRAVTGDLQKIDKTPAYAMNLGTLSSKDLISGAEASDESGFGSYANGRVGKPGRGGGAAAEGGQTGDKGGALPADGQEGGGREYTPTSAGEPGAGDTGATALDPGGTQKSGGTGPGQTGTNGLSQLHVTINLPTVPRLLAKRR
jgi:hypothetical protein